MKPTKLTIHSLLRIAAILLCLAATAVLPVTTAQAKKIGKNVRVGWYDSTFNELDSFGRRSGYGYEYQQKIAAYTGWNYEYVEGSWAELMQMLSKGEIDLLSDVSYTEERAEYLLYPTLPMGMEEYYLFIASDNEAYSQGDYSYFNGKKIGITKGTVQTAMFQSWMKENSLQLELIELTCSEMESMEKLEAGELDGFVTLDAYGDLVKTVPVVKIGSSDFYFAVAQQRPDLLLDLNAAINRIQDENRFYNQQLYEKYVRVTGANRFLSAAEQLWLSRHDKIRVAYQDNYLAFCDADDSTGELTGALKDYLDEASHCLENGTLEFEPVAYLTADAAYEALKRGKVDCVFPSNLSTSDGEAMSVVLTPAVMKTDIYALVRKANQDSFSSSGEVTAALIKDDPNESAVLMDHFPDWKQLECDNLEACMQAVADKQADCVLISNYQYNNLSRQCSKLNLTALSTGETEEYTIAVDKGNPELYSILTRTTVVVNNTNINTALTYYSTGETKTGLFDFLREHPAVVVAAIAVLVVLLVVIVTQQRMIRAKKEIEKSHNEVYDLSKRVYVDALTSVRNKGAFDSHLRGLQNRLDCGEEFSFAVAILDCDNLKLVNDEYGHEKGDMYLQASCRVICRVFRHSPVFRIGGDEFAAVLENADYENRAELCEKFEKTLEETVVGNEDRWEQLSVSVGVADYDPKTDSCVDDVVQRADKMMYEHKRARKKSRTGRDSQ